MEKLGYDVELLDRRFREREYLIIVDAGEWYSNSLPDRDYLGVTRAYLVASHRIGEGAAFIHMKSNRVGVWAHEWVHIGGYGEDVAYKVSDAIGKGMR